MGQTGQSTIAKLISDSFWRYYRYNLNLLGAVVIIFLIIAIVFYVLFKFSYLLLVGVILLLAFIISYGIYRLHLSLIK